MQKAKPKKIKARSVSAVDKHIGVRMREQRLVLEMSQAELGMQLGISFQQIQKYESGKNRVSAGRLLDICKALNVPLSSMFEGHPRE